MTSDGFDFEIRVEPLGVTLRYRRGESLIECAWRHGYYWPTICGGRAECGACRCTIKDGVEHAGPMSPAEEELFKRLPALAAPSVRLACQLRPQAPITVVKAGVQLT